MGLKRWCTGKGRDGSPSRWSLIFGLDKRSMALYRLAMGYVIIWDVIDRWCDIYAFYTDDGVHPRSSGLEMYGGPYDIGLHMVNGSLLFMNFMFTLHLTFGIMFFIGYRTRLASIMLCIFCNSLLERNLLVSHGGDIYFRVMHFWQCFIPLSAYYSVDAAIAKWKSETESVRPSSIHIDVVPPPDDDDDTTEEDDSTSESEEARRQRKSRRQRFKYFPGDEGHYVTTLCTIAPVIQLFLLYESAHEHKTAKEWVSEYTALYYALELDFFRSHGGDLMLMLPWAGLKFFVLATLFVQRWGGLTWICPIFTGPLRSLGSFLYFGMHSSMQATMRLGMFSRLGMAAPLILFPWHAWEAVLPWVLCKERNEVTLYLPNHWWGAWAGRLFAEFFFQRGVRVVPCYARGSSAASTVESGNGLAASASATAAVSAGLGDHPESYKHSDEEVNNTLPSPSFLDPDGEWTLVSPHAGEPQRGYDAVVAALALSPLLWFLTPIALTGWARRWSGRLWHSLNFVFPPSPDSSYEPDFVIDTRADSKTLRTLRYFKKRLPGWTVLILCCLVFCVILSNFHVVNLPYEARLVAEVTRLDQAWPMFAPRPPDTAIHHVIEALLINGTRVDIMANRGMYTLEPSPLTFDYPDSWTHWANYKNHRWFKVWESLMMTQYKSNNGVGENLARYICREWNSKWEGTDQLLFSFRIHQNAYEVFLDQTKMFLGSEILLAWQCLDDAFAPENLNLNAEADPRPPAEGGGLVDPKPYHG